MLSQRGPSAARQRYVRYYATRTSHRSFLDASGAKEDETRRMHEALPLSILPGVAEATNLVHILPDDVLYTIFMLCCDSPKDILDDCSSLFSLDTSRAPWTLSYVCQRWRSVVLNIPQVWAAIYLRFYRTTGARLLKLQISRARHCPLILRLSLNPHHPSIQHCQAHPYLRVLTRPILEKVVILRTNYTLPAFRDCLPKLQSLHITSGTDNEGLGALPCIRTLVTENDCCIPGGIDLEKLENYRIRCASLKVVLPILSRMTSLVSLDITFYSPNFAFPFPETDGGAISLPALQTLALFDVVGNGATKTLLLALHMPRLERLELMFGRFCQMLLPSAWDGLGEMTMLREFYLSTVQAMDQGMCEEDQQAVKEFLKLMPHVRETATIDEGRRCEKMP
ncbi:hypothetical protein CYLTODRAFT_172094 [Cylindrobasidium torrendii FP15055 ss-10]|uniref:Uncharacterized protein n=1 Tax=Cylindrobasidium torrendii FP15055 ss-10 TaxID=1314674 RepID=A0A0D7BMA3_9AGAR|nr:hypothetical protein CYLTODRAFT_172094 [Cylindrobasidium torrendii FP15055 ss-10]